MGRVGQIEAKCPECGAVNRDDLASVIVASTLPGFARCKSCGKVFPAKAERAKAESEADDLKLVEPELIVPDQIAVEYGWRAWKVRKKESKAGMTLLQSVSHDDAFWQPRVPMEAVCKHDCGDVPGDQCRCGLYAAMTLPHLKTMRHYFDYDPNESFRLIGKVALWGKVIEGTQGWKATYGYPSELYLPFEAWHLHNDLKESYGVPVYLKNFLRKESA
jgi:hypothetical protein